MQGNIINIYSSVDKTVSCNLLAQRRALPVRALEPLPKILTVFIRVGVFRLRCSLSAVTFVMSATEISCFSVILFLGKMI